jgi:hypothetical protein
METDEKKEPIAKSTPRRKSVRLTGPKKRLVDMEKILASGSGRSIP